MTVTPDLAATRVADTDWAALAAEVDAYGCAPTAPLLTPAECRDLTALYEKPELFRTTVDMARHRFGSGQYRYFTHDPLPEPVAPCARRSTRACCPSPATGRPSSVARRPGRTPWRSGWSAVPRGRAGPVRRRSCCATAQGDWNALHRDVFGDLVFPLQVVIGLDEHGTDYTGGEFLLVEQRPRAQSRGTATVLPRGHGLIFTTRDRPVRSAARLVGRGDAARGEHRPLRPPARPGARLP